MAVRPFKMDRQGNRIPMPIVGKVQETRPGVCGCAFYRFLDKHKGDVISKDNGALAWKQPTAPVAVGLLPSDRDTKVTAEVQAASDAT